MNYSNDIKLESDKAVFYFRHLEWDTTFFNRNSYILDVERSKLNPCPRIKELFLNKLDNSFITIKVDSQCSKEMLDYLQMLGFKYISTEVCLKYNESTPNQHIKDDSIEIKKLKKNKNIPHDVLGSVYELTRFHYDTNITKEKADLLWIEYIRNYRPSPTKHMFIADYDSKIAGAILANECDTSKRTVLCFVSVIESFRKKKIGSKLIQNVINHFRNYDLVTGTQIRNIIALNFYIKNGFSIIESTKTVMHRWC